MKVRKTKRETAKVGRSKVLGEVHVRIGRGKYSEKHEVVADLGVKIRAAGYGIYPKTLLVLNGILVKAENAGTITDLREKKIVGAALAAAGIELARSRNSSKIKTEFLKVGFDKLLRAGGGNCQPHLCVRRSILSRSAEELEAKLSVFRKLSELTKE